MKNNRDRGSVFLDYAIGILMITILVLATFLMPQAYSALVDKKDLNQVHAIERENFSFESPVDMTVYERVQQMMETLETKTRLRRTLSLSGSEVTDKEFVEEIKEALSIAAQYELIPDVSAYDIENNIMYAEYYNFSDSAAETAEIAFWKFRFTDNNTFDFFIWIDANDYIIYQAELYCKESFDYMAKITAGNTATTAELNNLFMEKSESYFEAEGYGAVTDIYSENLIFLMGYERGEYAMYHIPCDDGSIKGEGVCWGFVPMTFALEGSSVLNSIGYDELMLEY